MTDNTDLDTLRKRLKFRAWHRGTREADLIFGSFVDRHCGELGRDDIRWLDALFEAPEQDALDWVLGRAAPPAEFDTSLMVDLQKLDYVSDTP